MFYLVETETGRNIYPVGAAHCYLDKHTHVYEVSIGDKTFASTKIPPIVVSDIHEAMAWLRN